MKKLKPLKLKDLKPVTKQDRSLETLITYCKAEDGLPKDRFMEDILKYERN